MLIQHKYSGIALISAWAIKTFERPKYVNIALIIEMFISLKK